MGGSEPEILCGESPVLQSGVGGCVVENQVSAVRRGVGIFCWFLVLPTRDRVYTSGVRGSEPAGGGTRKNETFR